MTAKKPKTPKPPKEDDYLLEPLAPAEADIEDFLTEWAPQTAVVEIYRRKEDGSQPHVARVGIEILRVDLYGYLRGKFGNGKYILQFKDQNRRIIKNLTVDVEGAPAVALGSMPPTGSTFEQQLLLTVLANMKPAPPPPPLDMGALMTGLGAILAALRPTSTADPAAMLTAMATTFQQLKPAEDNVEKALTIISKAKDIAGDGGGSSNGDSWPGLIKDGMVALGQVLKPNGQPPAAHVVQQARPAIAPGAQPYIPPPELPSNGQASTMTEDPDVLLQKWLSAQINFLKSKARAGKDVGFWIDYIFENQEEPGPAAILEAMRRGATFQDLLTFDAEIGKDAQLATWFQKFYETLHAELDKDLDTPGPGGNPPNPGGNEESST